VAEKQRKEERLAVIDDAVAQVEQVLKTCNTQALDNLPALTKAVKLAAGVSHMRRALTEQVVKDLFMPLVGTPLGMLTDRDKEPEDKRYPWWVVRDCVIEGMIHGLQPTGNEINVISGRMYPAKNGLDRLVHEWPGLTDLKIDPGVPHNVSDKGSLVSTRATFRLNGRPMVVARELERNEKGEVVSDNRIPVRVNSGMGPDGILGKAERKLLFQILKRLKGNITLPEGDGDVTDTVGVEVGGTPQPPPAPPEQDGRRMSMSRTRRRGSQPRNGTPEEPPTNEDGEVLGPDGKPEAPPDPENDGR
jgi:hypothetical protein